MNHFYITGTSTGLGKAISELLLTDGANRVYGISRRCTIKHERYEHITLDLSNVKDVEQFRFKDHSDAGKIALINNAGILGDIKRIGNVNAPELIDTYNVNLTSPSILCNNFIRKYSELDCTKIVINVSSGAGKRPVDAWGGYCATKAGLDMFTQVMAIEQEFFDHPFHIFSVAPGIVDTPMQDEIRKTDERDFSNVQTFIQYKEHGDLKEPEEVAEKYIRILNDPMAFDTPLLSVRDM